VQILPATAFLPKNKSIAAPIAKESQTRPKLCAPVDMTGVLNESLKLFVAETQTQKRRQRRMGGFVLES
jgi:hypothetical protein